MVQGWPKQAFIGERKDRLVVIFGWLSCFLQVAYFFMFMQLYPGHTWFYGSLVGGLLSPLVARLVYVPRFYGHAEDFLAMCSCIPLLVSCAYSGHLSSPSLYWFTMYPLGIGLLSGKKKALMWSIGIIAFVLGLVFLEQLGIGVGAPTLYMNKVYRTTNALLFVVFVSSFVVLGVASRDRAWSKVRDQREDYKRVVQLFSHDLTTPLTVLKAQVHRWEKRLSQGKSADVKLSDLEFMQRSFGVIEEILFRVRNIEAISSGKTSLSISTADLNEVVHFCCDLMADRAGEKKVTIHRSFEVESSLALLDSSVFRSSVLTNLLINAVKFSFEGGQVFVGVHDEGAEWVIRVEDRGIGMAQELVDNLFDFSVKTSRAGTAGETGTGFGMPLVKTAIDAMGGRVEVQSISVDSGSINHGTTVRVFVPKALDQIGAGSSRKNPSKGAA